MQVHYKKTTGVVLLILATVSGTLLVLSGAAARMDITFFGPALATLAATVSGIAFLTRPYFQLEDGRITLFAAIGPLRRVYPFGSVRELRLVGNRLYLGDRKLPISRGQSDRADWERFMTQISG
jgi:hypothetical protein